MIIIQHDTSSTGTVWNGRPSVHVPLLTWNNSAGLSRMSHEMLQPQAILEAENSNTTTINNQWVSTEIVSQLHGFKLMVRRFV